MNLPEKPLLLYDQQMNGYHEIIPYLNQNSYVLPRTLPERKIFKIETVKPYSQPPVQTIDQMQMQKKNDSTLSLINSPLLSTQEYPNLSSVHADQLALSQDASGESARNRQKILERYRAKRNKKNWRRMSKEFTSPKKEKSRKSYKKSASPVSITQDKITISPIIKPISRNSLAVVTKPIFKFIHT